MSLTITALYAGLLGIWLIVLSARVIRARRSDGVSLGDGGQQSLARAIRGQGNFCEYAPVGLVLMAVLEVSAGPAWLLHLIGVLLLVGRLAHGYALSFTAGNVAGRVGGMLMTFGAIGLAAAGNLAVAVGVLG